MMEKTHRIEYIDALRGFTMLLVVYGHILVHCFDFDFTTEPSFNSIISLIRMPIFFFISGFIMYKKDLVYDIGYIKSFVSKKFRVQIITTLFFLVAYSLLFSNNLGEMLFSPMKGGFWFTVTLFEYFILYIILKVVIQKFKSKWLICSFLVFYLVVVELFTYYGLYSKTHLSWGGEIAGILGLSQWTYFKYFVFGTFIKHFYDKFIVSINNKYLIPSIFFIFFILVYSIYYMTIGKILGYGFRQIVPFLGIIIILSCFKKYEPNLSKNTQIGKVLQFIGTRTLDIYLLHYFFLPRNLNFIGDFFTKYNNIVIEFTLSIMLSLIVIGICLLVSSVLRVNPVMAKYLFGVKYKE